MASLILLNASIVINRINNISCMKWNEYLLRKTPNNALVICYVIIIINKTDIKNFSKIYSILP